MASSTLGTCSPSRERASKNLVMNKESGSGGGATTTGVVVNFGSASKNLVNQVNGDGMAMTKATEVGEKARSSGIWQQTPYL